MVSNYSEDNMQIILAHTDLLDAVKEYLTRRGIPKQASFVIKFKEGRKGNGSSAIIDIEIEPVVELSQLNTFDPIETQTFAPLTKPVEEEEEEETPIGPIPAVTTDEDEYAEVEEEPTEVVESSEDRKPFKSLFA